jgi:outer membrane protein OmpA-like peptidoglycan-associated protein
MRNVLRFGVLTLGLAMGFRAAAFAEEDVAGSRDHPLVARYPGSHITEYRQGYDSVEFRTGTPGKEQKLPVEGNTTFIRYFYDSADQQPTPLQLLRNYQNAIRAIGGELLYERLPRSTDGGETTLRVRSGGKEYWVRVVPEIYSAPTQSYTLTIVELSPMEQVVTASAMLKELESKGFVALYIQFDTGRHELKPEAQAVIREIVTMLRQAPKLKLSIEGHTDNVGNPADNLALSERRAQSVLQAIVKEGIEPSRLRAVGYGQERPIADNRTEEGRAKNRRVELVKQ